MGVLRDCAQPPAPARCGARRMRATLTLLEMCRSNHRTRKSRPLDWVKPKQCFTHSHDAFGQKRSAIAVWCIHVACCMFNGACCMLLCSACADGLKNFVAHAIFCVTGGHNHLGTAAHTAAANCRSVHTTVATVVLCLGTISRCNPTFRRKLEQQCPQRLIRSDSACSAFCFQARSPSTCRTLSSARRRGLRARPLAGTRTVPAVLQCSMGSLHSAPAWRHRL